MKFEFFIWFKSITRVLISLTLIFALLNIGTCIPNVLPKISIFLDVIKVMVSTNFDFSFANDSLSPVELIEKANYTCEIHNITTEDGYILTVLRIPGPSNSTPVFLQHGLLESSVDWLITGRGKSLAYILSDNDYDVWLGNARGNAYSRGHVNLTHADEKFWDFSWEELGRYDLPAVITYVKEHNGKQLFYIGHSMGVTQFSVMAIERPDIAKNVKALIALAPATYVYHMIDFQKTIARFWKQVQAIFQFIKDYANIYELLTRSEFVNRFSKEICNSESHQSLCRDILFVIGGYNPAKFNDSLIPAIWSSVPAGTSLKLYVHFMQQINVNKFRRFDYGEDTNLKVYNSIEPPSYDLSKVQVPVAVFWSTNDWTVGLEDVEQFYNPLPLKLGSFRIEDSNYNHFDFLWATDAPQLVYSNIVDVMKKVQQ